jgi:transposase
MQPEVTVITGVERRRIWTEDQKREVLEDAFAPGACVEHVAKRRDIPKSLIYRWRKEERVDAPPQGLAQVVVTPDAPATAVPEKVIEIILAQKGSIHIPVGAPADLATAVIKATLGR